MVSPQLVFTYPLHRAKLQVLFTKFVAQYSVQINQMITIKIIINQNNTLIISIIPTCTFFFFFLASQIFVWFLSANPFV